MRCRHITGNHGRHLSVHGHSKNHQNTISKTNVLEILSFVFEHNNSSLNREHYLQVEGMAMGTRVAPTYADLYGLVRNQTHIYTYHLQLTLYWSFIDDIFMLWDNNKFSAEISDSQLGFLNTQVIKDSDNQLYTDLYCKPTDANNYLHYNSLHWRKCKDSIVYSQFIRICRICKELPGSLRISATRWNPNGAII